MNKYILSILAALFIFSGILQAQRADKERLEEMVSELASDEYKGRSFGSEHGIMAADYIIEQFKESGVESFLDEYRHRFDHRNGILNIVGNNIVGIVRSSNEKLADEYIILGGHYDHLGWKVVDGDTIVYNGADDNASGVASIIELGRIFTENQDKLGRSIILIAFDGEESGLNGSKAFVRELIKGENAPIKLESVAAMFSLDMVGMYEAHKGVGMEGIELLSEHELLMQAALKEVPITITKSNSSIENRTDTAPFGEAGIPAVHVFTGTESPYHKPEDDSDLLDYDGMVSIVDFMAALSFEISNAAEVPKARLLESIAENGGSKFFKPAFTVNLGSSHHDIKNDYFKAKSVFAYSAGFSLETRLSSFLAFQPEVMYEWNGSQVSGGSLHTHSVTVPISLLLSTPDQGSGARAFYQIGGYYSYAFAGKENGNSLDFVNTYNDTDYGIVFGFGLDVMNLRIAYVFQRSLLDFVEYQIDDVRLKSSYFKMAWLF